MDKYSFQPRETKRDKLWRYFDRVTIYNKDEIFKREILFGHSFADAEIGKPIAYLNSLHYFSLAINQQSIANKYKLGTGNDWRVVVEGT